jgi:hypothetical protein
MVVKETKTLPQGTVKYNLFFKGSGDPNEEHEIMRVEFLDKDDQVIFGVGHEQEPGGRDYSDPIWDD